MSDFGILKREKPVLCLNRGANGQDFKRISTGATTNCHEES